ncbi:RNA-directed DNA polymerase, eukaryota [Tanacetum coccineum]
MKPRNTTYGEGIIASFSPHHEGGWIHDEDEIIDTQFKEKSHHSQNVSARITTDAVDPFLVSKGVATREHSYEPMIIASLNINGVGSSPKKKWVRNLCYQNHVNFIGIQESKSTKMDIALIHSLRGNNNYDFASQNSVGNFGGTIAIWNNLLFKKDRVMDNENGFLAIFGECLNVGTVFCNRSSNIFNEFISITHLVDLPMGGRKFTRMNKRGTKLSKIDRFLETHHFLSKWPNVGLTASDRDLTDHCPLVLKTHSVDYGPTPFKFFNSWLLSEDFPSIVALAWQNYNNPTVPQVSHPTIFLKNKLQNNSRNRPRFTSNLFKSLSDSEVTLLDAPLSHEEIKNAVWSCGSAKSPGPDRLIVSFLKVAIPISSPLFQKSKTLFTSKILDPLASSDVNTRFLEEIQESVDEEPIVNTDTQQEAVTLVKPDDISLPIYRTSGRVSKPSQFYYDFHIEEDKISDSTLSELD